VKSEPNWNALPATVPAYVRTIVARCLVKDRKARIPDLSVVRYMLDGTMPVAEKPAVAPALQRKSSIVWQAATALFVLTTIVAGALWYRASTVAPAVARFQILPPDNTTFTAGSRPGPAVPVISPDGHTVAFTAQDATGKRLLWVRPIDSLAAQPLAGTDGAAYPFWSPDSRNIGYAITGKLLKVGATGGPVSTLCALNPGIISRGGSWSRDNVIIFNNGPAPLSRVPASGGDATVVGALQDGETGRQFPVFLPDGRHFLYNASGSEEKSGIFVGSLDSAEMKRVAPSSNGAIYDAANGHLLFVRQGTLVAQTFDVKTFTVSGDAFPVAERVESTTVPGIVAFSLSDTGVLAYGVGDSASSSLSMTWVDRTGKVISTAGPEAQYRGLSLSHDGKRVAAHRHEADGGDIWITDLSDNRTTRLTFDATQENSSPVWSPDDSRIAYASARDGKAGISVRFSNNTGAEERVFETSTRGVVPNGWSPDGQNIIFSFPGAKTSWDLWLVPVSGDHKAVPLLQTSFSEGFGQYSPDGRWITYSSTETGISEVYVQPASMSGGKFPVSNGGGMVRKDGCLER
jgi:Tol biopolymer transport system component